MPITAVRNSPIGWRDQNEDSWTQCENTYGQAWVDGQTLRFQVVAGKIGQNILDNPFTPYLVGTTTADGSSSVTDAGASFLSEPISADHLVVNASTGAQTNVASVISDAVVSIDSDIFGTGTSGDTYQFLDITGVTGNVTYNPATDDLTFTPRTGNNSFVLEDVFPVLSTRYVVEVDIENYEGGELEVEDGTYAGVFTPLGTSPNAVGNGTWSFYGIPTANDVRFIDRSEESAYDVTAIRIYETSQVKWYLTDSDFTTEFDNGTPAANKYFHDRCLVEITPSVADGEYGVQIEDRLLTINGGYIRNTAFAGNEDFGWTITNATSNGWAIASNQLQHTSGGGTGTNYAEVELRKTTDADCNYRITADITGDAASVEGKDADGNYTTLGTLSGTVTFTGGAYTHLRLSLTEVDTGTVDNIVLEPVLTCPDLESYPICIADSLDSSFLKFTATIAAPSTTKRILDRWLQLGNSYSETMYLGSNIRFARYEDSEGEQYRDSDGRSSIVFSDRVKVHECQLAPVPVWVHDWVTWALRTTLTIGGVEFYPFDLNYSPNWDKRTANAPVVFDVAEQDQDVKKTLCD